MQRGEQRPGSPFAFTQSAFGAAYYRVYASVCSIAGGRWDTIEEIGKGSFVTSTRYGRLIRPVCKYEGYNVL